MITPRQRRDVQLSPTRPTPEAPILGGGVVGVWGDASSLILVPAPGHGATETGKACTGDPRALAVQHDLPKAYADGLWLPWTPAA